MNVERIAVAFGILFAANTVLASETLELKTFKEKVSYAIGMDMGNSLKKNGVDINPDILAKAIKDVLTDQKTQITNQEAVTILTGGLVAVKITLSLSQGDSTNFGFLLSAGERAKSLQYDARGEVLSFEESSSCHTGCSWPLVSCGPTAALLFSQKC